MTYSINIICVIMLFNWFWYTVAYHCVCVVWNAFGSVTSDWKLCKVKEKGRGEVEGIDGQPVFRFFSPFWLDFDLNKKGRVINTISVQRYSFLRLFVASLFQDKMGQFCMLVFVLFVLLASLSLTIVALLTDSWYRVYTGDNINPDTKKSYNFNYGLWRLCYEEMPTGKTCLCVAYSSLRSLT